MPTQIEEWKGVVGFEGFYQVSSLGRIRSLDRRDLWGRLRKGRILKTAISRCGYEEVRISVKDVKGSIRIHREVAKAFIPNLENKPQVNHIDGIKTNNMLDNLEWMTNKENQLHAYDTGLNVAPLGTKAHRYKSPVKVFDIDGNYLYSLNGNKEMKEHGFDYRNVSAVVTGKRPHYKGHIFRR